MLAMRASSLHASVLPRNGSTARLACSASIAPRLVPAVGARPAAAGARRPSAFPAGCAARRLQLAVHCASRSGSEPPKGEPGKGEPGKGKGKGKGRNPNLKRKSKYIGVRPAAGDGLWTGHVSHKNADMYVYPPGPEEAAAEWHDVAAYCTHGPSRAKLNFPDRDWASDPRVQKYCALPEGLPRLLAMREDNGIKEARGGVYVNAKHGGWEVSVSYGGTLRYITWSTREDYAQAVADLVRLRLRGPDGAAAEASGAAEGLPLHFPERVGEYEAVLARYEGLDTERFLEALNADCAKLQFKRLMQQ